MSDEDKKPDDEPGIELTKFIKSGPEAVLTKTAYVDGAGKIKIDGSKCRMSDGNAYRLLVPSVQALAAAINALGSNEAIAIGALKEGVRDGARVVTKRKLPKTEQPDVIARTKDFVIFPKYKVGYILLDVDTKGIPQPVRDRVAALGGAWPAIVDAVPKLAGAARVIRKSSSSGISNPATGETRDSDGEHIFALVNLATAIPEILKRVHDTLWLAGLGWYVVGAAGQMLERSLIDTAVGSPERLVFEGPVILADPLVQSPRPAIAFDGRIIDIKNAVLPWGGKDDEAVSAIKRAARIALREECEIARAKWSASRIQNLVENGYSESDARAEIGKWLDDYRLTGEFELHFVAPEIGVKTVAEVLVDPGDFIGQNLYDLFEDPNDPDTRCDRTRLWRGKDGKLRIGTFDAGGRVWLLLGTGEYRIDDFIAFLPHPSMFIYLPDGTVWKGVGNVDILVKPRDTGMVDPKTKKPIMRSATQDIREFRGVRHMTWAPGEPRVIVGKFYSGAGWIHDPTAKCYNSFQQPPDTSGGDANLAGPWVDHVKYLFPDPVDHSHIFDMLAYIVQNVGGKINHALVLAGEEGIGKDTVFEPLGYILGTSNVRGVSPDVILDAEFDPYKKHLVLIIEEARDVGNNRYKLNNKLKPIIATTSTGLYVNEKGIQQYDIPNRIFVGITTNYPDNELFINERSRRYFVATSEVKANDPNLPKGYFNKLYAWIERGGFLHVAAFLRERKLKCRESIPDFDPKAWPPMNKGTKRMMAGGLHTDVAKLEDLLDSMGMDMGDGEVVRPKALTVHMLAERAKWWARHVNPDDERRIADKEFYSQLAEGRYPRNELGYRLADCGYTPVHNPPVERGSWLVKGKRVVIYVSSALDEVRRLREAEALAGVKPERAADIAA